MRLILMTGKGGVGENLRSCCDWAAVCGIGIQNPSAEYRSRSLLSRQASTENRTRFAAGETEFVGSRIRRSQGIRRQWGLVKRYITQVLRAQGLEGVQAEEFSHLARNG